MVVPAFGAPRVSTSVTTLESAKYISGPSDWGGSLGFGSSQNQDQFSDAFMSFSADISYQISPKSSFNIQMGYSQPYSSNADVVRHYGITDTSLAYSYDLFAIETDGGNDFSVNGFFDYTVPTSETSRKASLRGAGTFGVSPSYKWSRLILSTSHSLTLNLYEYETADEFGSSYNYPYMLSNGFNFSLQIFDTLSWSSGYSLSHTKNYADTQIDIQSVSTSLSYKISKNYMVAAHYRWRDRLISNNALFDDDTSIVGMNIKYVF